MEQIALIIHLTTATLLILTVLYTDHVGLSWIRGKVATVPLAKLVFLHRAVWTGLIVMLLSGFTMFLAYRDYLLTVPAFYAKMAFVVSLIINAFFIGKFMRVASEKPFAVLTSKERLPLFISGAVSTACWISIIICAFMLGL